MTITLGSAVVFDNSAAVEFKIGVAKLGADDAIVGWESLGDGYACHLDITTSPPTAGASAAFSSTGNVYNVRCEPIDSTRALLAWADSGLGAIRACVASLSGTTVSFGSSVSVGTISSVENLSIAVLTSSLAVAVWDDTNGYYQEIGISGTTLSVSGAASSMSLSGVRRPSVVKLSATSALMCYFYSSGFDTRVLSSVTSTSSTLNSATQIENAFVTWGNLSYISSTAALVIYPGPAGALKGRVLTISGTSVTSNSDTDLQTDWGTSPNYDPQVSAISSDTHVVGYTSSGSKVFTVTVSGTTITDNGDKTSITGAPHFGSNGTSPTVAAYTDASNSYYGTALLINFTTPPQIYTGTNTVTYRSDLPSGITDIKRGALLVRSDLTTVVIGSAVSNSVMLAQATSADTYGTWTDITDSHPTDEGITAVVEI